MENGVDDSLQFVCVCPSVCFTTAAFPGRLNLIILSLSAGAVLALLRKFSVELFGAELGLYHGIIQFRDISNIYLSRATHFK